MSPGLAAAVARLEASSRAPRWFADPAVQPGHWVHFEAPLALGVVGDAAAFVDTGEPSDTYPSGGRLHLLLHGSGHHLTGAQSASPIPRDDNHSLWARFRVLLSTLDAKDSGSSQIDTLEARYTARTVGQLSKMLQPGYTAAWMAGYARVTARIPTASGLLLAATPLYVEHIDAPDTPE